MKIGTTYLLTESVYYVDGIEGLKYLDLWARFDVDPDRAFGGAEIPADATVQILAFRRGGYTHCVQVQWGSQQLWVTRKQLGLYGKEIPP